MSGRVCPPDCPLEPPEGSGEAEEPPDSSGGEGSGETGDGGTVEQTTDLATVEEKLDVIAQTVDVMMRGVWAMFGAVVGGMVAMAWWRGFARA